MRYLTLEECADPEHKKLRDEFGTHITDWVGAAAINKDFYTSDLTPECVYYEDLYSTIHEGSPYEVLLKPESEKNYVYV